MIASIIFRFILYDDKNKKHRTYRNRALMLRKGERKKDFLPLLRGCCCQIVTFFLPLTKKARSEMRLRSVDFKRNYLFKNVLFSD